LLLRNRISFGVFQVLNQTPHEERSIIDRTKFHLITLVIDMCPFFEMWDLALKVLGVLLGGKFDPLEPVEPQTEGWESR
jgi:hypothetical protein